MTIGMILAAGKQTRFESDIPKCLNLYKKDSSLTILEKNILTSSKWCKKIYVVLEIKNDNSKIESVLTKYNNVEIIYIESGKGTGAAVLDSFKKIKYTPEDNCFLMWGDSIQDSDEVFEVTLDEFNGLMTVPVHLEENCYVEFVLSDNNFIVDVYKPFLPNSSKSGYHDYSLFLFNINSMILLLDEIYNIFILKDEHTSISLSNIIEFDFLSVCKLNPLKFNVVFPTSTSINAFNTIEEYHKL